MFCASPTILGGQELDDVLPVLEIEDGGERVTEDELLRLEQLIHDPLDLNRVDRKELEDIPLLNSPDAALIIQTRNHRGGFHSVDEVREIPGISVLAARLLPLVTTVTPATPIHITLRNRWITYDGDARILTQSEFEQANLSGGLTLERDPGERSLSAYVSGHVVARTGEKTTVIMGDHQAITGYGLLFGPTTRPFKTPTGLTRFSRPGRGLRPHHSTREGWALRGVAVSRTQKANLWWVSLSSSPSETPPDVVDTQGEGTETVAVLGWERTPQDRVHYGTLLAHDRWTAGDFHSPQRPSRSYGSIFGKVPLEEVDLFGEIAVHTGSSPAVIAGLVMVEKNVRWIATVRHYPMGFRGPRSQPFREFSSESLNETGLYQALIIRQGNHRFLTQGDIYRHAHSPYSSGGKTHGFEAMATWTLHLKNKQLSFRWKGEERRVQEEVVFPGQNSPGPFRKKSWRLRGVLTPNRALRLQIQLDRTDLPGNGDPSPGYGLSTRVRYSQPPWRLTWSWTGFQVGDSRSRIYIWDLNLPAELRIKSFTGRGQSSGLVVGLTTAAGAVTSMRIRTTWKRSPPGGIWTKPQLEGAVQMDIAF
ncbi:MAG: ComEA family DNA-binding protein [Fidelibacterota bacterium]